MVSLLTKCFVLGCAGVTMDIVFTGVRYYMKTGDLTLQGKSQIWILPLFALAGLILTYIPDFISRRHLFIRIPFYAFLIMFIELVSGLLFIYFIGECPWVYTEGWHVYGCMRVDYFPWWMLGAGILEYIYKII